MLEIYTKYSFYSSRLTRLQLTPQRYNALMLILNIKIKQKTGHIKFFSVFYERAFVKTATYVLIKITSYNGHKTGPASQAQYVSTWR